MYDAVCVKVIQSGDELHGLGLASPYTVPSLDQIHADVWVPPFSRV